jgi:hypothetical protein
MRDPVRLGEQSESELESALLGVGGAYRSSARARAKTLAALGLAGSATAVAVAAAATSLGKLTWLKVVAAVAVVGAAAVPVGYSIAQRRSARAATTHAIAAAAPADDPSPRLTPDLAPNLSPMLAPARTLAPARSLAHASARPARTLSARRGPRRVEVRAVTSNTAGATLTQELVTLDAARAELAHGDAGGALSLLETYGRAYPHGDLVLEAEVLRMDALARSGHADLARQRAVLFLKRHPN